MTGRPGVRTEAGCGIFVRELLHGGTGNCVCFADICPPKAGAIVPVRVLAALAR